MTVLGFFPNHDFPSLVAPDSKDALIGDLADHREGVPLHETFESVD